MENRRIKQQQDATNRVQLDTDLWFANDANDQHLSGREQAKMLLPIDYATILDRELTRDAAFGPSGRVVSDHVVTTHRQFAETMANRYDLNPKAVQQMLDLQFPKGVADMRLSDLCRIAPPEQPYGCINAKNGKVMVGRRSEH